MNHRHFCDAVGHEWNCDGKALRPDAGDTEPSVCMCLLHQVPMDEGDHSSCPVELLACPEHRDEQQWKMKEAASTVGQDALDIDQDAATNGWQDKDGNPIVGFCLWCDVDFYTMEQASAHNADHSAACPAFQKFIKEQSTSASPPVDAAPPGNDDPQ
jgi:hypothetical protein